MRFVHTFWSKPLYNNKFNTFNNSLNTVLSNYGYSVVCIHALGEKIILYADAKGAELLSFIPYDEVIIVDNLENESVHCAAQIKFEALKQYQEGDVIIDGDLFIQNNKSLDFIKNYKGDILYSFFEPATFVLNGFNIYNFSHLMISLNNVKFKEGYKLPTYFREIGWPNTSLMKFNNKYALQEYIEQYEYHKKYISDIDFQTSWPDIIIEQYFLKLLCENNGYIYEPVIHGYPDEKSNEYAIEIGFTHLGSNKLKYLNLFNEKFKQLNPEQYYAYLETYNKYSI